MRFLTQRLLHKKYYLLVPPMVVENAVGFASSPQTPQVEETNNKSFEVGRQA